MSDKDQPSHAVTNWDKSPPIDHLHLYPLAQRGNNVWRNLHGTCYFYAVSTEAAVLATKRSTSYRDYPEDLKAAVVAAIERNDGNVLATAKLFNLPQDTVYYWWRNSERFCEIQKAVAGNSLADKLESAANQYTDSLLGHDMSIVTARDKAAVISVTIDKMQLLRGQPTSISLDLSRQDITLTLQSALSEVIDVTPE